MKAIWVGPEARVLAVQPGAMTLHVGKPNPTPTVGADILEGQRPEMRPIDWASANRIAGPAGMASLVDALVEACWSDMERVALIFANAPDQWPARHTHHDTAAERGTARSVGLAFGPQTPLDSLGLGGFQTHALQQQIRSAGKFASLDDVARRVPRIRVEDVKREIKRQVLQELTTPGGRALFFARTADGTKFRSSQPATPPA